MAGRGCGGDGQAQPREGGASGQAGDDEARPARRAKFGTGEVVVVTHSLGTVVAYHLLCEFAKSGHELHVPLLITMGSPLGVEAVKRYIDLPHRIPANIARWENYFDRGDPVSLGKALSSQLATGIVDDGSINNQTTNAHSDEGYLGQQAVRASLEATL